MDNHIFERKDERLNDWWVARLTISLAFSGSSIDVRVDEQRTHKPNYGLIQRAEAIAILGL